MKILLTFILFVSLLPLHAQTGDQSQPIDKFIFKFTPGDDFFYDNVLGNGEELQRLTDRIEHYRSRIDNREFTLYVEGYCASGPDKAVNYQMALTRSNRVKSRLIMKNGLVEDNFKTTNHTVAYGSEADLEVVVLNLSAGKGGVNVIAATGSGSQQPVVDAKTGSMTDGPSHLDRSRQVFTFRFVKEDNLFYDNVGTNNEELERLYELLNRYLPRIERGEMTIFVEGYCASGADREANRQLSVARSNRLKSRIIHDKGLVEDNFSTTNRGIPFEGQTDVGLVIIHLPETAAEMTPPVAVQRIGVAVKYTPVDPQSLRRPVPYYLKPRVATVETTPAAMQQTKQTVAGPKQTAAETKQQTAKAITGEDKREGILSLRANLLYRLANMINAGLEWKTSNSFGLLLNAGWSGTEWSGGDRKLRVWMVSPEVRWYLGKSKRWFLGGEGHIGKYNIKLSDTGYQGNFMGGGITTGYRTRLSRYFDMDFSLGLGYIRTEYDEYYRENGESVKINEQRLKKDIIGPTQVGVSLIWKLK